VALILAVVVGGSALTMELDPFAHPAKVPAIASSKHAPQPAVFLAISISPSCDACFGSRHRIKLYPRQFYHCTPG
jgi:hypothetical protein